MEPSTRSREHRRPEHVTDPQMVLTSPRAEVIQILASAVFALIAQGRASSPRLEHRHVEVIP